MRGFFRLNLFRNLYIKNSAAGDSPVTECGGIWRVWRVWRNLTESGGVRRGEAE